MNLLYCCAATTYTCTVLIIVVVADIGDTQEPGANVDGTQFVTQAFAVWLPAPVIASAKQSASNHSDSARSVPLKAHRCKILRIANSQNVYISYTPNHFIGHFIGLRCFKTIGTKVLLAEVAFCICFLTGSK